MFLFLFMYVCILFLNRFLPRLLRNVTCQAIFFKRQILFDIIVQLPYRTIGFGCRSRSRSHLRSHCCRAQPHLQPGCGAMDWHTHTQTLENCSFCCRCRCCNIDIQRLFIAIAVAQPATVAMAFIASNNDRQHNNNNHNATNTRNSSERSVAAATQHKFTADVA